MNDRKFAQMTKDWATKKHEDLTKQIEAVEKEASNSKSGLKMTQEFLLERMVCRRVKIASEEVAT